MNEPRCKYCGPEPVSLALQGRLLADAHRQTALDAEHGMRDDKWHSSSCSGAPNMSGVPSMPEPPCPPSCTPQVDSWYGEMADHLRSVDPNHLITTGEEVRCWLRAV